VIGLLARRRDFPLFQTVWTFSVALLRAPSLELKQLVCETGHLPPYIDEVKNEWSCASISHYVPACCAQGHLYFKFTLHGLPYPPQLPPVCFKYGTRLIQDLCTGQINPLQMKQRLLYLKTQFIPRSKHFSLWL